LGVLTRPREHYALARKSLARLDDVVLTFSNCPCAGGTNSDVYVPTTTPPSTDSTAPLMNEASSDARNKYA
jgi:hypothetical protein